ncbi:MAG: family 43 glycosylhydrolase [Maribacter sp.]|nr:family 43 glycosylhydrolase [Maribacter sp.]
MNNIIITLILILVLIGCTSKKDTEIKVNSVSFSFSILKGLEPENGINRRDPSDVIKVGNTYYLWYTKTEIGYSGYSASVWYASSIDGETWEEKGEAIPRGNTGSWDAYSVFTPNILVAKGKYYLFYTGVKPTPGNPDGKFENNSETDITAIGVVVANSPDEPFVRVSSEPLLEVSDSANYFDSYRVDDACIVYNDNKYYLYYKGRSRKYGKEGPKHTKLGVAISERPEGPYKKYENNPIITSGHEVMVWPYQRGIMALLSNHGPEGKTLQYAVDGLNFKKAASFGNDYPKAPGSFRVGDFTDASKQEQGISWGISMFYGSKEKWPHLLKYEIELAESKDKNK